MDADIRKTTLRMIPDALYVLTAAEGLGRLRDHQLGLADCRSSSG